MFTEYRVKWAQCPHAYHPTQVLFVEAATPEDARKIARDHIERKFGIEWIKFFDVAIATTIPAGKVVDLPLPEIG